ncbi:hypothetical protein HOP50_11g62600 [Chloropicon primus]|nr:hypothetical protein HOP50_11g62600 [Chloropicon primus]|mmetsp:Transcript_13693/g.38572  ORF Transcript_13693/g.38572 Transcript_13693/m.38572 type:complete len:446 (-) Transcript_13693:688-2025(-)
MRLAVVALAALACLHRVSCSLGNVCSQGQEDCTGENEVCKTMVVDGGLFSMKCVCAEGFDNYDGVCLNPGYCTSNADCKVDGVPLGGEIVSKTCYEDSNKCACPFGYEESEGGDTCFLVHHGSCEGDSDCAGDHELCVMMIEVGGRCLCDTLLGYESDGGQCVRENTLGLPCDGTGSCNKHENCELVFHSDGVIAETCVCRKGYEDDGTGNCVLPPHPFCLYDAHCLTNNHQRCEKAINTCVCEVGYNQVPVDPVLHEGWPGAFLCNRDRDYCFDDSDCTVSPWTKNPWCQVDSGRCVQCLDDTHCEAKCEGPSPEIGCHATNHMMCDKPTGVCTLPGTIPLPDGTGPTPQPPSQGSARPALGFVFPDVPSPIPSIPGLTSMRPRNPARERRSRDRDTDTEEEPREVKSSRDQQQEDDEQEEDEDDGEGGGRGTFATAVLTLGKK